MNEFCEEKGIKREYIMARTPQQNKVAERRYRILIKAARTMLADSKLPTTFWAEAVSTACYVQNRVLVVKPHFKIPCELFKGRSPALSFMRPFGCNVSILNTLDQLGKFDEKSDEGIFVGYSTTSKAFRVYNIRTRKVEENLHITFLENKPMITGGGPEWLSDIDALSKSINYTPVFRCTNYNDFNGKGASFNVDSHNKDKHGPSQANKSDNHERPNAESSTKTVNTARPVNTTTPTYVEYPNDPLMPDLEDAGIFDDAYDDRDEGAEAEYNNLEIVISVSLDLSTRIHKDHPKEHIIGEGHRKEEGIDYDEVFAHVARNKAIRLFLAYASFMDFTVYQMDVKSASLYGIIKEEVYVSQPLGFLDPEFPDRVYKVEKALYGLHQASRAWYETLSTYILDNRFRRGTIDKTLFIKKIKDDILLVQVYVDDIIFGSTKRSLSTDFEQLMHKRLQMSSIGELTFFLRLVKSASTLMETHKPLSKDSNGTRVDVYL
nr:retrovirus-related Pol polyprotein from transposon TNT 1-94 [Tanacetum cinerariifolium]